LPEAQDACALICQQCAHESLELPNMPRFPMRVELNRFAAALADGKAVSLFDYLLQRIRQRAERDLSADDLRDWLAAYPWLLVLDGLDEVPASSNRSEVLTAVQNFLVDAQGCNADLLLVATTRPQGYNDDFSSRYYRHTQLLPLDVPRALHYADRLVEQRWGGDADKVEKLMQRLERAGAEDATARLMQSPLQVTIMALLVETIGQPPKERWRLFNEYYQVIFRREKEREIPAAELLNAHQTDIDIIHQQVGLRLQADSERVGGTEALLTLNEFDQIVKQRLKNEGHKGASGERLRQAIIDAALLRLVFLVAPQDGKVGFEIRSLQEFMAAQCLMNGSDEDVQRRLRAIAPAAHWRNVFLFAAGRCFHEKQHLRDTLYTLCCELNEGENVSVGGELERATLAGSRLALEILDDGALIRQPAQLKLYSRLALRLLELPPCPEQLRLAKSYVPELEELYREEIQNRLVDGISERRLGAWGVLLQLLAKNHQFAQSLADKSWPADGEEAIGIVESVNEECICDWLVEKWLEAILKIKPAMRHWDFIDNLEYTSREFFIAKYPDWLKLAWRSLDWRNSNTIAVYINGVHKDFRLTLESINFDLKKQEFAVTSPETNTSYELDCLLKALLFYKKCSKEYLAEILLNLASLPSDSLLNLTVCTLPWPIQACIWASIEGADLINLSNAARSGALGDREDWSMAEERFRTKGLEIADFHYIPEAALPFDRQIASKGFPFIRYGASLAHGNSTLSIARQLHKILQSLPSSPARRNIASNLLFVLNLAGEKGEIFDMLTPGYLENLLNEGMGKHLAVEVLGSVPSSFWEEPECIETLKKFSDAEKLFYRGGIKDLALKLESVITRHPNEGGLLRLLAAICILGHRPTTCITIPDNFGDFRHQAAALTVRIAQANWPEDETTRLAEKLVSLGELSDETIANALTVIEKQEMAGRPVELLLAKLYSLLPHAAWEARRNLLRVMQEQQRRRFADEAALPPH
jgi:hypothetical protein